LGKSTCIRIEEPSITAEARRIARKMALSAGLDETEAEHVAVVVTEASTNVLKHAGHGQVLIQTMAEMDRPFPSLEVVALDQGPGLTNLEECLRDGYSTNGTSGHGLGAIMRLSTESDFYSVPGKGTAVLARWRPGAERQPTERYQIGVANVSKRGQEVCGDSWGFRRFGEDLVLLLADGLGHGLEAHTASSEAVRILRDCEDISPRALVDQCHRALRSTRGAAVAVARIDPMQGRLTFSGIGNLAGQIYSGSSGRQRLASANGTAGFNAERLQEFSYPWPDDGLLVFYSDGLSSSTGLEPYPGITLRDPALVASVLYRDFARGNDDATVIVAKAV
jgi:anti-sigma regulatory factor (Ser/Thr protein kinase)